MINPESVDLKDRTASNSDVEILFTDDDANPVTTIHLDEFTAMKLAHMIMDQCSYAAKIERGVCQKPKPYVHNRKRRK